eukprot:scpid57098/ scgid8791/ 
MASYQTRGILITLGLCLISALFLVRHSSNSNTYNLLGSSAFRKTKHSTHSGKQPPGSKQTTEADNANWSGSFSSAQENHENKLDLVDGQQLVEAKRLGMRNVVSSTERSSSQRQGPGRDGNPSALHQGEQAHRRPLVAVGSFTMEQLTMGCLQFFDFVRTAVTWQRDVVLPRIQGNYFIGLSGSDYVQRYKTNTSSSRAVPKSLDDYFDTTLLRQFVRRAQHELVTEAEAGRVCQGQWTVLVLMQSTGNPAHWFKPMYCPGRGRQHLRKQLYSTFGRLSSSTERQLAVEANCSWMLECMPDRIRQLAPFRNAICVGVPHLYKNNLTARGISNQLNRISSKCLLLLHWFGTWRHGIRTASEFKADWFRSSVHIHQLARQALGESSLPEDFLAVHIRSEFLFVSCDPSRTPPHMCGTRNMTITELYGSCFTVLRNTLSSQTNKAKTLLLSTDFSSDSMTSKRKQSIMHTEVLLQNLLQLLNQVAAKIINLDRFAVEYLSSVEGRRLLQNSGLRALFDAEILQSASSFLAVGGGHFQSRILALRRNRTDKMICPYLLG